MSRLVLMAAAAALALAACGERPQTLPAAKKWDSAPWNGPQSAFTAPGWKPGDEASWETQLHKRTTNQNEYVRIGTGS